MQSNTILIKFPIKKIALFIASGFYSGFCPKASGTAGSLAYLLIWYFFIPTGFLINTVISVLILIIGCLVSGYLIKKEDYSSYKKAKDPSFIVIDEWAGMSISLTPLFDKDLIYILIAFALFRFFDASKIFPVNKTEKLPNQWGIMLDDVVAGILSAGILILFMNFI